VGIMGMTRAVWVGQERFWIGHGLPGLIARTASGVFITRGAGAVSKFELIVIAAKFSYACVKTANAKLLINIAPLTLSNPRSH